MHTMIPLNSKTLIDKGADYYPTHKKAIILLPFVCFQYLQVSNSLTGSNTASAVQVAISLPEKPSVFSTKVPQSCSFSSASCVTCNFSISNLASLRMYVKMLIDSNVKI